MFCKLSRTWEPEGILHRCRNIVHRSSKQTVAWAQKHLIHHIFSTMNLTYYSNSYWQKVWSLGSGKNAVSAVVSCSRNAWKNHKKKNHWFVFSNHYTLYPALSWPVAIRARASVVWWIKCRGSGGPSSIRPSNTPTQTCLSYRSPWDTFTSCHSAHCTFTLITFSALSSIL